MKKIMKPARLNHSGVKKVKFSGGRQNENTNQDSQKKNSEKSVIQPNQRQKRASGRNHTRKILLFPIKRQQLYAKIPWQDSEDGNSQQIVKRYEQSQQQRQRRLRSYLAPLPWGPESIDGPPLVKSSKDEDETLSL